MDESTKPCRECDAVLPLIDFPVRKDQEDGHHWWCFPCKRAKDREYAADYRDARPEERRRSARRYARKPETRIAHSGYVRLKKYGLTPEAFAAKLAAQGGHCPFCPPDAPLPEAWDVDHDHRCCPGQWSCGTCVRAILCRLHNRGLGAFGDDPELLRAAADYIERHQQRIAAEEPLRVKAAKSGEGHQAWKGDAATHGAMRLRVYRGNGPADHCTNREVAGCTSERYEWVLTPGADPADPANWTSLCASCRMGARGYKGGGHFNAKVTDGQAAEMRERYATSGITQADLAAEYGISQAAVSTIVSGKAYKPAGGEGAVVKQHREKVAQDTAGSVSFGALRRRVYRANGPAGLCVNRETAGCTNEHYEWVLTHGADPAVTENWVQLCAPCRTLVHGTSGAGNKRAKLTQEDADAMRALYAAGGITQPQLAERFGVSQSTANNILLNRRYAAR
jgi:DNA-binding XRE family transcriptional regulator